MDLLPEELKLISPGKKIVPHCVLLKQDYTVFVTGLGRLDYVEVSVPLCPTKQFIDMMHMVSVNQLVFVVCEKFLQGLPEPHRSEYFSPRTSPCHIWLL